MDEPVEEWNRPRDTFVYPHSGFYWLEQAVFYNYDKMFKYFYQLEGCGKCKLDWSYNSEEYDKDKHGLDPITRRHFRFIPNEKDSWCSEHYFTTIPTKDVEYPPLSNEYTNKP